MKKLKNKLFLCLMISTLIIPMVNVYAEEGTQDPSPSPTASATPVPTPSESPKPTPEPTPSESPTPSEEPKPTPTPTPSATPTPTPKAVAELESLEIEGVELSPKFSKNTTEYTAVVSSSTNKVRIKAKGATGTTVIGTGEKTLRVGKNNFTIYVNAGTTDRKEYSIEITRANSNLTLKSLKVQGQSLNEAFDADLLNYTLNIPYNMDSVNVQATAADDAEIEIQGDKNLKVGANTVRIIVKNKAGESQEYRITVTRASEDEQEPNDDGDSTTSTSSTSTNQIVSKDENPGKGNTLRYVFVVIFCLILLAVAGVGIYFYIKTGDSEKRKQKKLEKIKKQQEKLNHQLTDLNTIEKKEEPENIEKTEELTEIDELEDTIELDKENFEEETREVSLPRRSNRNVLEDMDDIFLDE